VYSDVCLKHNAFYLTGPDWGRSTNSMPTRMAVQVAVLIQLNANPKLKPTDKVRQLCDVSFDQVKIKRDIDNSEHLMLKLWLG